MSEPRREPSEAAMMAWGAYADGFAPETAQEYAIKVAFLDGYQDAEDATAMLLKVLDEGVGIGVSGQP